MFKTIFSQSLCISTVVNLPSAHLSGSNIVKQRLLELKFALLKDLKPGPGNSRIEDDGDAPSLMKLQYFISV